jgi:hypothetical protein
MNVTCAVRERPRLSLAIRRALCVTVPQLQTVLEIHTAHHAHLAQWLNSITLFAAQPVNPTPAHQIQETVSATKGTPPPRLQPRVHSALRENTKARLATTLVCLVSKANTSQMLVLTPTPVAFAKVAHTRH